MEAVSLRPMTSKFQDIVNHKENWKSVKCIFCDTWFQNFVWNFKGALWNFTQNFEPYIDNWWHRKVRTSEVLSRWALLPDCCQSSVFPITNIQKGLLCFVLFWLQYHFLLDSVMVMPSHDDVIKWKHFPRTGPLCRVFPGHHWIPLTKASDAELWCFLWSAPWINGSANNRGAGDLRRHRAHYGVILMITRRTMRFICHTLKGHFNNTWIILQLSQVSILTLVSIGRIDFATQLYQSTRSVSVNRGWFFWQMSRKPTWKNKKNCHRTWMPYI